MMIHSQRIPILCGLRRHELMRIRIADVRRGSHGRLYVRVRRSSKQ